MNVRSPSRSTEGGGTLLPFRGNRDGEVSGGEVSGAEVSGGEARGVEGDGSAARTSGGPTVVRLRGRDGDSTTSTGTGRRDWVRFAVVAASAVVVLGGGTAAALTGVVPVVTERPVPQQAVSAPPTVAGPAQGPNVPAAYGLCKAFDRAAVRGDEVATALAFRNLAHAAGGASQVSAYCAPFGDLDRGRAR